MTIQQALRSFQKKKSSMYMTLAVSVLLLLVLPLTVFLAKQQQQTRQYAAGTGNDLYVSSSGSDSNACTQASPCATITHAATLATPGTTVHVAPGTYTQAVTTNISGTATGRITLISDVKWGAKIQTTGVRSSLFNRGDYVDIIGFDITGDGYIGINNKGSYTRMIGNRVHDMPASPCDSSGGAGINDASYTAHDDDDIGNITYNIGTDTCKYMHGIYHSNLRGHIYNNISYGNSGFGIHLWHAATATIISNNLVFQNRRGGISIGAGDAPGGVTDDNTVVANNIVVYNDNYAGIREAGQTGTNNLYLNNLVYANPAGAFRLQNGNVDSGTLMVDPQFVNYQPDGSGDYHLQSTSPMIDKGTATNAPTTDFDGNVRPQGAGFDIGAYEYTNGLPITPPPTLIPSDSLTNTPSQILSGTPVSQPTPVPPYYPDISPWVFIVPGILIFLAIFFN